MTLDEHPLFARDADDIAWFVYEVSGSPEAGIRRLSEIADLRRDIVQRPMSAGVRLGRRLQGCLARHGGRDNKLTIICRPDERQGRARFLMVSFGGHDWMDRAVGRP